MNCTKKSNLAHLQHSSARMRRLIYLFNELLLQVILRTLVAIPSYNNGLSGYSITNSLDGLVNQTQKDFSVLVVYRPSPSDKTMDIVDSYRGKLDIKVVIQDSGYIEEAMNRIYEVARDYHILLTLDDDATPANQWVSQHLFLHQSFDKLGALGGIVSPSHSSPPKHGLATRFVRRVIGFNVPLFDEFSDYFNFINDMGLDVETNPSLINRFSKHNAGWDAILDQSVLLLSVGIGGANSSVKTKHLEGFRLPGATVRGIGYEQALWTYLTKQGVKTAIVNCCAVYHLERESLSRARTNSAIFETSLENYIRPYLVNLSKTINQRRLGNYRFLLRSYASVKQTLVSRAYLQGLDIALMAIQEGWRPSKVRDAIIDSAAKYKSALSK